MSCVWLFCDPIDCGPPGSSVHGIPQARILGWVPIPSPGDGPRSGMEPSSPALTGGFFTTEPPGKPLHILHRDPLRLYILPILLEDNAPWISQGSLQCLDLSEQHVMRVEKAPFSSDSFSLHFLKVISPEPFVYIPSGCKIPESILSSPQSGML